MDPRPAQTISAADVADRWLDLELFDKPPLAAALSGLEVEYRILQLSSRDAGKREATLAADVGQGSQDIGFRNDAPILFTVRPSVDVTLRVRDEHGQPTVAAFVIRDAQQRVYPSPAKRLAPDFAFHPQVYRADGETVRLAEGAYDVEVSRGPEYVAQRQRVTVGREPTTASFALSRWIDLPARGWYSGDHHIHAAGCLHYETPTIGVEPRDMIRHILGEALSVGSVLTWGPGYYYQRQFFEGRDHALSTRDSRMRYDVEVSGFPSSHAGHLVLLRLKDQDYPGVKTLDDWPTWTLPILQWAKAQGAVVGFAHSGFGLEVKDTTIPTLEMPRFDGIGANEYIVDVTHDAVDFISTVDTPAPWELNIWYHTLNAGFRTRISGETDFPCIYGDRVGMGRSYVRLDRLDYDRWADGIRSGRAYVTDGKSHLVDFRVDGVDVGTRDSEVRLARPGTVTRHRAGCGAAAGAAGRRAAPAAARQDAVLGSGARAHAGPGRHARGAGRDRRQRPRRGDALDHRRRHDARREGRRPDRAQQLGRAAHPAVVAHQSDVRARRRPAGARVTTERRVVPARRRSVLVAEGARRSPSARRRPRKPPTNTRDRPTAASWPKTRD